jgi:hypothetical protein
MIRHPVKFNFSQAAEHRFIKYLLPSGEFLDNHVNRMSAPLRFDMPLAKEDTDLSVNFRNIYLPKADRLAITAQHSSHRL